MSSTPLDQLRLRWRDHTSALWWLGLLCRRPKRFHETLQHIPRTQQLRAALLLWLHSLPYIVALSGLGRMIMFGTPKNLSPATDDGGKRPLAAASPADGQVAPRPRLNASRRPAPLQAFIATQPPADNSPQNRRFLPPPKTLITLPVVSPWHCEFCAFSLSQRRPGVNFSLTR